MSNVIDQWHELVQSRDASRLERLLADDVVFYSPVMHTPQAGRARTQRYLTAAVQALGNDTFRYVHEIVGPRSAMLEFTTELDGIIVNGVDIITWNEDDQIVEFKVMLRPLKALGAVSNRIVAILEAEGGAGSS